MQAYVAQENVFYNGLSSLKVSTVNSKPRKAFGEVS